MSDPTTPYGVPPPPAPLDLDALERVTQAATPGRRAWFFDWRQRPASLDAKSEQGAREILRPVSSFPSDDEDQDHWVDARPEDLAFLAAMDRETVLHLLRLARAAEALLASGVVLEHDAPRLLSPLRAAVALRAMGAALEGRAP